MATKTGTLVRDIVVTRVFDAPRELVFEAWTKPEHVTAWWGPKGYTTPFCTIDLRVGGECLSCMRSPEGKDFWSKGVYQEIVEPEKIVITDSFADAEGNIVPASQYGMGKEWPLELLVTVTFEDQDGKTKMTLRHAGIPTGEHGDMCQVGWSESFDKLAEYLAKASKTTSKASFTRLQERDIKSSM